jgi:dUTP pyrophosphatase
MNKVIVNYRGVNAPAYQTEGSAGCDLVAAEDVELAPGKWAAVGTGLFLEIPVGYAGYVCPRSGLALKSGISVLNSPGIIDSDYRGEVKVILVNHTDLRYKVKGGDRIAQLLFVPVIQAVLRRSEELSNTARGSGGFGSTGY